MADLYAERRRKKALAKSKVKIRGFDVSIYLLYFYLSIFRHSLNLIFNFKNQVMLTEKVVFCVVTVPLLWIIDGLILAFCTNLDRPTIALILGCFPLFAYTGIIVSDAGMVDLQDLRPYVMRALPSTRKRLAALPQTRKQLKDDLRKFIKTMGPTVGEVYYGNQSDWQQIMRRVNSSDIALNNKASSVQYEPKKTK
jgi:glycerol-3-phosphate O-acyltransferase/dihydroxyacetone phosphate acyltransferase